MILGLPPAVLVMACVATTVGLAGIVIVSRPARSEQAVYGKRIAGTMTLSLAFILALFAWGLLRITDG